MKQQTKYETLLFDLDGTLIDTNELIIQSFEHTLRTFYPEQSFPREDIIQQMGLPLRDMFSQFSSEHIEDMVAVYREHNIRMHDRMVTAFPFVKEVISTLFDYGLRMGIVTTKQRNTAQRGLRLCGLDQYMSTLISLGEVEHPKPHPEPVLKAMEELGALPQTTLMIGDNRYDIESAQRAGIDAAGVSWTLKGAAFLQAFEPTYMLQDMRDLYTIVGLNMKYPDSAST